MAATLTAAVACTLAPPPTAAPASYSHTHAVCQPQRSTPAVGETSQTAAPPQETPVPAEPPTPTPRPAPTQAPTAVTPPMPPPTETATPTGTPAPTVTRDLPTRTPLPTLSPEAVADHRGLVPGWVENRSELTSFLLSLKQIWPEASALLESLEWVQDGIGNSTSGRDILEVDRCVDSSGISGDLAQPVKRLSSVFWANPGCRTTSAGEESQRSETPSEHIL